MINEKNNESKFIVQSDVVKLSETIIEIVKISEELNLKIWLNYGALLGLIREKRLLPWNNDAELSCWYEEGIEEKFKLITDEMNKRGYHAFYYSTIGTFSVKAEGVVVNVNLIWEEGNYGIRPHETPASKSISIIAKIFYWMSIFMGAYPSGFVGNTKKIFSKNELIKIIIITSLRVFPRAIRKFLALKLINLSTIFGGEYQKTAIPIKYINQFVEYDFYNEKVLVPKEPENLVKFIYGEEWNIPKENWSFYKDKNKKDSGMIFLDEKFDYKTIKIV
jgi:hypothetical protein